MTDNARTYTDEELGFGTKKADNKTTAPSTPSTKPLSDMDVGFDAPARGFSGWARDVGATALKGAISVPEAAVGLLDIPTGGRVGRFLENKDGAFGFRPKEAKEAVNEWHSDATKQAQQKFQQADGLVDKFGVALENPSLIATTVGEAIPSMFAGGLVGRGIQGARGLMAAREASKAGLGSAAATKAAEQAMAKGATLAGAAGEGAMMAGAQASAIRQETEDGLLTPGQAGLSLATGVIGTALGYGGGKLAERLGVGNMDTMLAQGQKGLAKELADTAAMAATNPTQAVAKAKSLPRQVIEGAIVEGLFEELPQSVTETVIQNLALNKPWAEGLNDAIVLGTLSGMTMGGGAAGYKGLVTPRGAAGDGAGQQPSADATTPPADNWTTSPGAAPLNGAQPGTGVASPANHPFNQAADFGTAPGAALVHDNALPFEREFDTGNLAASPVDSPLESPAPAAREFDTGNMTLLPSEQMGLRTGPDAGPLENVAALSVDSGASPVAPALPATAAAQAREVIDTDTGEVSTLGAAGAAALSDEQLRGALRNAQSKEVRAQVVDEIRRRRDLAEQSSSQEVGRHNAQDGIEWTPEREAFAKRILEQVEFGIETGIGVRQIAERAPFPEHMTKEQRENFVRNAASRFGLEIPESRTEQEEIASQRQDRHEYTHELQPIEGRQAIPGSTDIRYMPSDELAAHRARLDADVRNGVRGAKKAASDAYNEQQARYSALEERKKKAALPAPAERIAQLQAQADAAEATAADWGSRDYKPNGMPLPEQAAKGGPADVGEANEQRRLKAILEAKGRAAKANAQAEALIEQGNAEAAMAAQADKAEKLSVAQLAAISRKQIPDMTDGELVALASATAADHPRKEKLAKAVQKRGLQAQAAINEGAKADGTQPAQAGAKKGGTQPAAADNAGSQGGMPVLSATGSTSAPGDQTTPITPNAGVEQAQAIAREGNARRAKEAGESWARMPLVERQALVAKAGLTKAQKTLVPKQSWENLVGAQKKLMAAMDAASSESETVAQNAQQETISSTKSLETVSDKANKATKNETSGAVDVQAAMQAAVSVDHLSREELDTVASILGVGKKAPDVGTVADVRTQQVQTATESMMPEAGPFGPILTQYYHDAQGAIKALTALQDGEAVAALYHPDVGDIDLVWGKAPQGKAQGLGLAKLRVKHPEVLGDLQGFLSRLKKDDDRSGPNRVRLVDPSGEAVVSLDWKGEPKRWLLTAYEYGAGAGTSMDTASNDLKGDTARLEPDSTNSVPPTNTTAQPVTRADVETAQQQAAQQQAAQKTEAKQEQFANNKLFTADKVAAARERMRKKLGTLNSGIDPELLVDGMTIAGAYIESGIRSFADYAKAMVEDMGDGVKPYLLSFWEGARNYPGLDTTGMTDPAESARQHQALLTPDVREQAAEQLGTTVKKPAQRTRKTGAAGDMTLTQDWGVEHIDGYSDGTRGEIGNATKDAFLKEAKQYLSAVANELAVQGFEPHADHKGKPGKAVSVNESGMAGSGDVSLTMRHPDSNTNVYVHVGDTALRGMFPSTPSGISVMARISHKDNDKYGMGGQNKWMPVDLSATDLAKMLLGQQNTGFQIGKPMDSGKAQQAKSGEAAAIEQQGVTDAGTAVHGNGDTPLERVASEDDAGAARGGPAQPRGTDGEQESSRASGQPDADGDAKARSRGDGSAGNDSVPARAGNGRRGRVSASGGAGKRKRAPGTSATAKELQQEAAEEIKEASAPNVPGIDFAITDELELGKGTESVKFADNLKAIRTLKQIEQEGRRATPEEQRILARYVGWGGLKNAFRVAGAKQEGTEGIAKGWEKRVEEVEALLTPAELRAARNSTTAAHYTSQSVVDAVWKAVQRLGFNGGAVLEPSVGTGNFLGLMPQQLRGASKVFAVEYDSLTARIAQQLYPNQSIIHSGLQNVPLPNGKFALAIGNPPFGKESLYFRHNPVLQGKSIHNQFFLQSLDALAPGGVMGMVVSHNLMDAQDFTARLEMAKSAQFLGAIRLPDTAFKENARTEVVTDIMLFRKRDPLAAARAVKAAEMVRKPGGHDAILESMTPDDAAAVKAIHEEMMRWVPSSQQKNFAGSEHTISVNPYFLANPKMVLGTMDASGTMNNRAELNVRLGNPQELAARLEAAVQQLPQLEPVDDLAGRTLEQFEQMATAMRLAVNRAEPGAVQRDKDGKLKVVLEMDDATGDTRKALLTEIELTKDTPFNEEYTLLTDGKWQRTEDLLDAEGKPVKKLKKDGTPSNLNEKTVVVYDSLAKIPAEDKWGAARIELVSDMLPLRDAFKRQMMLESSDAPAKMIEANRQRLAGLYKDFVKKHGSLHKRTTEKVAMTMPDGALVLALENVDKAGNTTPAEILSKRVTVPPKPAERAKDASEAVAVALAESGEIDIERIAQLLGTDTAGAEAALSAGDKPRAFFDPETNRWEPADGYLSGMVRRKLLAAKAAGLEANVKALEAVQPELWDATQITPAIGASWVPAEVYADFLKHLGFSKVTAHYSKTTNTFSISTTGKAKPEWTVSEQGLDTEEIVQRLLNSRAMKVMRKDADGKQYVDQEGTAESQMKAGEIANEFMDWAFSDDERRERLVGIFNEKYNTRVMRQRDGSHLMLPGKVPDSVIKMRPWQLNAVWRGITDNAVLYDHAVGAGKTFTAIARIMERRRMGLSKKPMVVVPNHLVEQWAADVRKLYPGANILAATKNDFEKARRRRLFARIGSGDYDMVIVGHSSFGFIDIDPSTEERYLDEELRIAYDAVQEAEEAAERDGYSGPGKPLGVAQAERLVKKLEERLAKVRDTNRDRLLTFEEMGIDDLTVDEAHEFKNLAYSSNLAGISGMGNKTGSQKALDLNLKIRSLKERQGTSVAFLTGTPISNSVSEMYLVLRNLMPQEMAELGFENFDAWRTNYVSAAAAYEPTEAGGVKEVTRLGREWSNMRSLMELYYTVSDAVTLQDMKDDFAKANPGKSFPVPKVRSQLNGGGDREMVAIKPNEQQRVILRDVVSGFEGLDGIKNLKERNATRLRLMDRARKVSLDARAVDPNIKVPDGTGKIGAVVGRVFDLYNQWESDKGTQLIFLDRSVPKTKGDDAVIKAYDKLVKEFEVAQEKNDEKAMASVSERLEKYDPNEIAELRNAQNGGWNAYDEIKRQLVAKGIPANEIRFVQEANTDIQKAALFADVNAGRVRVLIGSSPRMGAGTNVQERLVALHHVDVTWKPSDIEQREGRIVRQGNELLKKYGSEFAVDVIAYATEMTVDAKMWSLNATKLKAINGVRKYDGSFNMEFEDEESASMAEMAALATGNPLMVERVVLDGEIKKLEMAERGHLRRVNGARSLIRKAQQTIEHGPRRIELLRSFAKTLESNLQGIEQRSKQRRITIAGEVFTSDEAAMQAVNASIDTQRLAAGNENARYVVEINGEKLTNIKSITNAVASAFGDPGFEAEVNGVKYIDIGQTARAIMELHGDASKRGREFTLSGIRVDGMDVELDVSPNRWNQEKTDLTMAVLNGEGVTVFTRTHTFESPVLTTPSVNAGLVKLLGEMQPNVHLGDAASLAKEIDRAKSDLPALKAQAEKPFAQEQDLKQKRKRLEQVISTLSRNVNSDTESAAPVAQTETEAFKRWFGNSKVVDENGKPLVMYHGTGADFSVFDDKKRGSHTREVDARQGFFLTSSPEIANEYAEEAGANGGANIMPAYVSLQNPLVIDEGGRDYDAERFRDYIDQAQEQGHDGVLLRNTGDGMFKNGRTGDTVIAFRSEQIKSAIGNNGNFDPENPDIANFAANPARRPGSAQDKAVMQAIADGKTTRDVLRLVANGSKDPFLRQVARLLLKAGITPNIQFGHIGKTKKGDPIHGQYRGESDTIAIAGSAEYAAERIFMHEAMHAATMRALKKPGLPRLQLQKLLEHVRKHGGAAGFYGLKNVDEFVAEVFTNPDFQAALRTMRAPAGSPLKSAWHSFVQVLRRILGLGDNSTSVLSQALELGVAAVREDMGLRKQGVRGASRANAGTDAIDQTQTAAFKRWFGDSKVVDADGKPLVVYHGSPNAFFAFDKVRQDETSGDSEGAFWFASENSVAEQFGSNVTKAFLSVQNLFQVDAKSLQKYFPPFGTIAPTVVVVDGRAKTVDINREVFVDGKDQSVFDLLASGRAHPVMDSRTRKRVMDAAKNAGADGVVFKGFYDASDNASDIYAVFEPTQIKSATGNNGNFDPDDPDILNFGTDDWAAIKKRGLQAAHNALTHPGKMSLWDKTVGTMRHIAERYPAFKPVYDAAQQFIDDVASLANTAANVAPRLIPRVDSLRDMLKKPISVDDNKAIAKALFEGTLDWGRDQHGKAMPMDELRAKYAGLNVHQKAEVLLAAGKVNPQVMAMWRGQKIEQFETLIHNKFESAILKPGAEFSEKELKEFFNLNDQQISLYQEARATVAKSLDITARAEMMRRLGSDFDYLRAQVFDAPSLSDAWKLLDDELESRAREIPDSRDLMADKMFQLRATVDRVQDLLKHGYMPLSRFGKYTLEVIDQDGERVYFGLFESQADSNRMALQMRNVYKGAKVTQGTMNDEKYKLFAGITPETAELFGNMLGLDEEGQDAKSKAFQEYLRMAKNNHSALKRLIHRKGTAGYSEDVGRVLASFVYSNARLAATGLNAGRMEGAIHRLNTEHKEQGELGKIAMQLREYIQDPQEEGMWLRGMLFAQYLGGSIASALVNITQPFAVTIPWLSQYGGMAKASAYMTKAVKDMTKKDAYESDLAAALKQAEDDGVVSPQEIHQLMAQARGAGGLRTGDGTKLGNARAQASNYWEKVKVGWGQPFALAEQFNRRSTFIAAYRLAKDRNMDNPAEFARRAVLETQFVYTKANKPQWARGTIGGTLFTFKTYSVSYLELLQRMWTQGGPEGKRAVAWAMVMLMLMGGAGGLPFMEDVEDLIDGMGQMMGYNISAKEWRKQAMADVLGQELSGFLEQGLSGLPGAPIDVSGRLGMGNLIPGTGLFLNKQSNTRDVVEMMGPAGDLVSRGFSGARSVMAGIVGADAGRIGQGLMELAPNAVRNAAKGVDMMASGMYKDTRGNKIIDTTFDEALWKMIGFQPGSVAQAQEGAQFQQRTRSFYTQTSNEIRQEWARALFNKDERALERVRDRLAAWNEQNPELQIRINMADILKRVNNMKKDRAQRMADTAPRAMRQQMQEWAAQQR